MDHDDHVRRADVNAQNLAQYDLVLLSSTTGCFLDDLNDKAASDPWCDGRARGTVAALGRSRVEGRGGAVVAG